MKYLLMLVTALTLSSCGDTLSEYDITKVTLDSGLECIQYRSGHRAGISCNWEKYNKAVEACLAKKNEPMYDKNGNELIFPPVKGECDNI
jgi:hypothetical protein